MKKKNKILIDRILGVTLCFMLRMPTYIFELILRRNHHMPPKSVSTILVAKYIGIGSILQSTPMLLGLKKRYPKATIIYLTTRSNFQLVKSYKFIDDVICIDDSSFFKTLISSMRVIAQLITKRVDLFLDLEIHSIYGSLMALFSCAKNRLGFFMENANFKAFMYTHLLFFNSNFPIRHCYNQLAQLAGVNPQDIQDNLIFPSSISKTTFMKVKKQIDQAFDFKHKGLIAINPNASDTALERRWSQANFAIVSNYFANQGYAVALVGSPSEYDYVNEIFDMGASNKKSIKNFAGVFSLLEFFVFLKHCNLLITNDSGVMNMALTTTVPQLLLAGPVNPNQYFIKNDYRSYIYHQTYCSPCTHKVDIPPCGGDNKCMQEISTEEVIASAERLLSGKITIPKHQVIFSSNYETLGVLKNKGIL